VRKHEQLQASSAGTMQTAPTAPLSAIKAQEMEELQLELLRQKLELTDLQKQMQLCLVDVANWQIEEMKFDLMIKREKARLDLQSNAFDVERKALDVDFKRYQYGQYYLAHGPNVYAGQNAPFDPNWEKSFDADRSERSFDPERSATPSEFDPERSATPSEQPTLCAHDSEAADGDGKGPAGSVPKVLSVRKGPAGAGPVVGAAGNSKGPAGHANGDIAAALPALGAAGDGKGPASDANGRALAVPADGAGPAVGADGMFQDLELSVIGAAGHANGNIAAALPALGAAGDDPFVPRWQLPRTVGAVGGAHHQAVVANGMFQSIHFSRINKMV